MRTLTITRQLMKTPQTKKSNSPESLKLKKDRPSPQSSILPGQVYGSSTVFHKVDNAGGAVMRPNGKVYYVYAEFEIVSVGDVRSVVRVYEGNYVPTSFKGTIKNSTILNDCVLIQDQKPTNTTVKNVVKTIKQSAEIYIAEYNDSWIDRMYNRYCRWRGRDRPKPVENIISEEIIDEV